MERPEAPSIEALLDALHDPDRYVAAHVLLSDQLVTKGQCANSATDGWKALYNGLRVDLHQTIEETPRGRKYGWKVEIPDPEKQRAYLIKRWERLTVVMP